ncbi:hypothetical protein ACFO0N_01830 [Halobium salinum]|uniref:Uncharacterized protein n=1 Tax=Halobium salinum TaxID=1364940 RepID=A0ABD5P765_9EURY|nr:hypothetical protein [Halobium salinum]
MATRERVAHRAHTRVPVRLVWSAAVDSLRAGGRDGVDATTFVYIQHTTVD